MPFNLKPVAALAVVADSIDLNLARLWLVLFVSRGSFIITLNTTAPLISSANIQAYRIVV